MARGDKKTPPTAGTPAKRKAGATLPPGLPENGPEIGPEKGSDSGPGSRPQGGSPSGSTGNAKARAKGKAKSEAKGKAKGGPGPEKLEAFLDALSRTGNVSRAAGETGLERRRLYARRKEDPAFAAAWAEAAALGAALLEEEAWQRACQGWEEPVWHKGEQCGSVRKFSERLLILLLKAHLPDKYQESRENRNNRQTAAPTGAVDIYRIPDNGRD
jgi:hypothetical protein